MRDGFSARVRATDDGPIIALSGTLDRTAQGTLDDAYTEASGIPGEVLLDFDDVEYINSTGIALIVGVLGRARAEGRPVGATGLDDHYREVFEITRLSDFMHIRDRAPATD